MITLVIKGPRHEAIAAAKERGINATFFPVHNRLPEKNSQTVVKVENDPQFISAIHEWYREKASIIRGFGYPIGTLLHYQYEV